MRILTIFSLFFILLLTSAPLPAQNALTEYSKHKTKSKRWINYATFNIRYDNGDDAKAGRGWKQRRDSLASFIRTQ